MAGSIIVPLSILSSFSYQLLKQHGCRYAEQKNTDSGKWLLFFWILSTYVLSFTVLQNGKDPGKFRQLDEILYVEGYPAYQQLMSVAGQHMELVCEVKGHFLTCFIVIVAKGYDHH